MNWCGRICGHLPPARALYGSGGEYQQALRIHSQANLYAGLAARTSISTAIRTPSRPWNPPSIWMATIIAIGQLGITASGRRAMNPNPLQRCAAPSNCRQGRRNIEIGLSGARESGEYARAWDEKEPWRDRRIPVPREASSRHASPCLRVDGHRDQAVPQCGEFEKSCQFESDQGRSDLARVETGKVLDV